MVRIRMPADMWERFGAAIRQAEPELDRSKVIREFVRWYLGDDAGRLPRRPHKEGNSSDYTPDTQPLT